MVKHSIGQKNKGGYKYNLVAPVKKNVIIIYVILVSSIHSILLVLHYYHKLYNGLSFNDILNWKGVY